MALIIASERVGEVGSTYDADAAAESGVNVPALIEGGFVVEQTKKKKTED